MLALMTAPRGSTVVELGVVELGVVWLGAGTVRVLANAWARLSAALSPESGFPVGSVLAEVPTTTRAYVNCGGPWPLLLQRG